MARIGQGGNDGSLWITMMYLSHLVHPRVFSKAVSQRDYEQEANKHEAGDMYVWGVYTGNITRSPIICNTILHYETV